MRKYLLGKLCFGEESQTLRVGRNMIIVMRLIPYDARSTYYFIIDIKLILRNMLTSATPLLIFQDDDERGYAVDTFWLENIHFKQKIDTLAFSNLFEVRDS